METENTSIRPALPIDSDLLYRWRNDPWIVALGSQKREVTHEEHKTWFAKALKKEDIYLYLIEKQGEPIGQVRFVRINDLNWEISTYLLKEHTGKSIGVWAIKQACMSFDKERNKTIVANILLENERSKSAFQKAGFSYQEKVDGHEVYILSPQTSTK